MIRCVVIDDEAYSLNGLMEYIKNVPQLVVVKTYNDPVLALNEISVEDHIDLAFIDVEMPLLSGVDLAKDLRSKIEKIVFTTSHSQYAVEAFDINIDAYLLKPYSFAKFNSTFNRLFSSTKKVKENLLLEDSDQFFVKDSNTLKLIKVKYDDVVAIESLANYVKIHTTTGQTTAYLSLTEMTNTLKDRSYFIKVQRSYIISKKHIASVDGNLIIMSNNLKISIGPTYKEALTTFLAPITLKTKRI